LISIPESRGKTNAINALALHAQGEILVVSDADVLIKPDAIRTLVAHFSDPGVGAVCARRSSNPEGLTTASWPAKVYNEYESAIKRGEGALGRVLGGDGSLYAVRRACFRPLPLDVPDDFVNVLRVLAQGKKVRYERNAVSMEEMADARTGEFARKRRTVARGIRGVLEVRALLNPFRFPLTAFLLFSHKILRWSAGLMMLALLVVNAALIPEPGFSTFFALQIAGYAAALAGTLRVPGAIGRPLRTARFFVSTNAAAVAGILDVLLGRDWNSWNVQREAGASGPCS
jgi:cellulose synthase/poly-beta-1,6-N-acetylglucosamine synthase-like glycosyltransferase